MTHSWIKRWRLLRVYSSIMRVILQKDIPKLGKGDSKKFLMVTLVIFD